MKLKEATCYVTQADGSKSADGTLEDAGIWIAFCYFKNKVYASATDISRNDAKHVLHIITQANNTINVIKKKGIKFFDKIDKGIINKYKIQKIPKRVTSFKFQYADFEVYKNIHNLIRNNK